MLLRIDQHTGQVSGIGWSPDGKRLVSGSSDDTTRIWDAETGAELLTLSTPGDWWVIPDWSPDGQHLLVSIVNIDSRGQPGVWRVWQTTEELVAYAKECCVVRQLTEAELAQSGLPQGVLSCPKGTLWPGEQFVSKTAQIECTDTTSGSGSQT